MGGVGSVNVGNIPRAQNTTDINTMDNAELEKKRKELLAQQQQIEDMKKQGLGPDGRPLRPEFQGISDANGNLKSNYQLNPWQNVKADTGAIDQFKATAMRQAGSNSPWAKLMLDKQKMDQMQAADEAGAMNASGMNSAMSRLAQSGGLSGGARERMMANANLQGLLQRQQVARQGKMDRNNIMSQDESQRMNQLQTLQGMQNQQADIAFKNQEAGKKIDQYNVGNMLGEVRDKRMFDANTYDEAMRAWAADKSAQAQAKAAGGGGKK